MYQREKVIYQVSFEDEPGLQIACTGTTMGKLMKMSKMSVHLDPKNPNIELFKMFQKKLVTWNIAHPEVEVEDEESTEDSEETVEENPACPECGLREGDPLPTTVKGLFCVDVPFLMKIIMGWMQAIAGVSLPKGLSSNGGAPSIPEDLMNELGNLQSPLT